MKEFIKDIIIALIIVAAITFVIKPTIVKETSMEPTLYGNDYLILNKLSYVHKDHPEHGDIIVFRSDIDKDNGSGKKLLKELTETCRRNGIKVLGCITLIDAQNY